MVPAGELPGARRGRSWAHQAPRLGRVGGTRRAQARPEGVHMRVGRWERRGGRREDAHRAGCVAAAGRHVSPSPACEGYARARGACPCMWLACGLALARVEWQRVGVS